MRKTEDRSGREKVENTELNKTDKEVQTKIMKATSRSC